MMRVKDDLSKTKTKRGISLSVLYLTVLCLLCCCAGNGREAAAVQGAGINPLPAQEFVPGAEGRAEANPPKEDAGNPYGEGNWEEKAEETVHRGTLEGGNLTKGQQEAILCYMDRYYEALSSLEMKDLSDLFAEDAAGQLAFHENTLEYMIALRKMQTVDLRLDDYSYQIRVLEVQMREDGSVDIGADEQNRLRFALMPETTSEYPACRHDFTLVPENGRWVLARHVQWEGAFWNMLKGYQDQDLEQLADAEGIFAERRELLLNDAADDLRKRTETSVSAPVPDEIPLHAYDREAAVAYARAHAGERSGDWHDYSNEGGNCQNFASQCLLAGGIPMDGAGDAKWYWYGEALSDGSETAGCALSWINVDGFRAYARDNRGEGLAAVVDAGYFSGEKGDLIMMGTPEDWNHVVVISEVVKDENGKAVDYLICSNTTDVRDFPVSAYPSAGRSLIRILGWN